MSQYEVFDDNYNINIYDVGQERSLIIREGDQDEFRDLYERFIPLEEIMDILGYYDGDWNYN